MNAVVIGAYDFQESERMPVNEKDDLSVQVGQLQTNVAQLQINVTQLQINVAQLQVDMQHVQSDVAEIKTDLRATNQRIDALSEKTDKRFEALTADMNKRFDAMKEETKGIQLRLESWKVWALGLYTAQTGTLLWIMAKGFKWF